VIRLPDLEFLKEHIIQIHVEVLAGVYDNVIAESV
jgi:hypothetical protein